MSDQYATDDPNDPSNYYNPDGTVNNQLQQQVLALHGNAQAQKGLDRRQAMVDQLRQRSLNPGSEGMTIVGKQAFANPGAILGNVAGGVVGGLIDKNTLQPQQTALNNNYEGTMAKVLGARNAARGQRPKPPIQGPPSDLANPDQLNPDDYSYGL